MARLTVEQVKTINSKCGDNFKLDLQAYGYRNEKQLCKTVFTDDTHYTQYTLYYSKHIDASSRFSGIKTYDITLMREHYKVEPSGMACNTSGWDTITVETGLTKKMFNHLIELTNTKDLIALYDNKELLNKRVLDESGMIITA